MVGFIASAVIVDGEASWPARVVGFLTTPLQSASAAVTGSITDFLSHLVHAGEISEENERLQAEIDELRKQLVDYEDLKRTNDQYKEYLGLKEQQPDLEFMPAGIVARNTGDVFGSFVIDSGTLSGISLYDPVITESGLVGYISEVSDTFARVSTILDSGMRVGCYNNRTKDTGVLGGSVALAQDGRCEMRYINRDSLSAVGDLIVTTGVNGIFPDGLVIGTILDVNQSPQGVSLNATIQPAVDIANIDNVFVITSFRGQGSSLEDFANGDGAGAPSDSASSSSSASSSEVGS